mgnify:CR=1 FL=1
MLKHILVATDGSQAAQRASAYALELASQDPTAARRLELLVELEQKAQALTPGLQRLQADLSARVE